MFRSLLENPQSLSLLRVAGIFFVVVFLYAILHRWLWGRLGRYASATASTWDDLIVKRMRRPLSFLVLLLALKMALTLGPAQGFEFGPLLHQGIKVFMILGLIWLVDQGALVFFDASPLSRNGSDASTRSLLKLLLRLVFFVIGFIVLLDSLGVSVTPLLASLGVSSLAVALALQDTLSNFFSGVYMLVDRPIRPQDFIQIDDNVQGTVLKIGWRSTRLKTVQNNILFIPNSKLSASRITNYDLGDPVVLASITFNVTLESDLDSFEKQLKSAHPEWIVRRTGFSEGGVTVQVTFQAQSMDDVPVVRHGVIQVVQKALIDYKLVLAKRSV